MWKREKNEKKVWKNKNNVWLKNFKKKFKAKYQSMNGGVTIIGDQLIHVSRQISQGRRNQGRLDTRFVRDETTTKLDKVIRAHQ